MSKFVRDLYRKRLETLLGRADDDAFLALAWSISALQSDQINAASRHMRFRQDAVGAKLGSRDHIPPWMLETLINEFLRAPKERRNPGRSNKVLDCTHMDQMLAALQLLLKLENAEYGVSRGSINILDEMRRINHRQFEWQREVLSPARVYRSSFLYAEGVADQFLREKHGLGVHDLSLAGFALFSVLHSQIAIHGPQSLPEIGLTAEIYQRALAIISQPIKKAKEQACKIRKFAQKTAYLPSVLRRFPIIKLDSVRDVILAPLPELIIRRVTSGVSLDFFGAPKDVFDEIGKRFESYSCSLLARIMPNCTIVPEFSYGTKKLTKWSPDILVVRDKKIQIVVECKSTGMTYDAKFSEDPAVSEKYKIEDIGKGIFQIWRFFSHMRRGVVPNHECHSDGFGILLTLEDWFTMSRQPISKMFENARKRCDDAAEEILECDKRPIVLAWVEDFEYLQRACNEAQFYEVMRAAHSKKYRFWHLPGLVDEIFPDAKAQNSFAFAAEFENQSWWKKISGLEPQ
jgi:hypothetical protein